MFCSGVRLVLVAGWVSFFSLRMLNHAHHSYGEQHAFAIALDSFPTSMQIFWRTAKKTLVYWEWVCRCYSKIYAAVHNSGLDEAFPPPSPDGKFFSRILCSLGCTHPTTRAILASSQKMKCKLKAHMSKLQTWRC